MIPESLHALFTITGGITWALILAYWVGWTAEIFGLFKKT